MANITARPNAAYVMNSNIAGFAASAVDFLKEFFGFSPFEAERNDLRNLLILDDWALDDMGVTRADIHNALDQRGPQSPKEYLSTRRIYNMRRMTAA